MYKDEPQGGAAQGPSLSERMRREFRENFEQTKNAAPQPECEGPADTQRVAGSWHPTTSDRARKTLAEANSIYDRAARAQRFLSLAERNPEVAEMIDLAARIERS